MMTVQHAKPCVTVDHNSSKMLRLVAWLIKTYYYKECFTTSIDGDSKYLLNINSYLSQYMKLHPVREFPSYSHPSQYKTLQN
jgi:hypothetical protein